MIEGQVGSKKLIWRDSPKGKIGKGKVELPNGNIETVSWRRDDQGISIETNNGCFSYDLRKTETDEGGFAYELLRRRHFEVISGASFLKAGEGNSASAQKVKKGAKIKSQMPGKIVRILVKAGDLVTQGQAVIVMEAMKMENEIKAPANATIKDVKVQENQAVETGAVLLELM